MTFMFGISLSGLILRFIIGGIAVAGASIIANKVDGKIGGIFATLPAVFLAAILHYQSIITVKISLMLQ